MCCIYLFPYANDSIKTVITGGIHYANVTMACIHISAIQVKVLLDLLCLHSSNMLEKLGTPALSSLAHLPTYNFCDHAVYFHINKAHPFKLGLNVI